jgi:hypothetical protein
MKVRIFKPARNAMQSSPHLKNKWVIEYESNSIRKPEPLMGWTSSGDTLHQVRLKFDSKKDAINYAEEKGWEYTVALESVRKVKPRNYCDNFRYIPAEE